MAKETALVLSEDAAGGSQEPCYFGGFPGVWSPGKPIAVSELGFADEKDCLAVVSELGLPLSQLKVEAGSAPAPERPNHLESDAAPAPVEPEEPEAAADEAEPGESAEEAEA